MVLYNMLHGTQVLELFWLILKINSLICFELSASNAFRFLKHDVIKFLQIDESFSNLCNLNFVFKRASGLA